MEYLSISVYADYDLKKFILISKEMIPCHSCLENFMLNLVKVVTPCGSAIMDSTTYHFQVKKQIGSTMKGYVMSPANA